ncbi:MAG: transglutaminase family protein [Devosiaceae bacterium]|nr:transglutaminase family protein [Devosiaceae bacterium MH13]
MRFTITHTTRYSFTAPVELHPHRLMVRPRDGHHLRIVDTKLSVSPHAQAIWSFDVFGNSVGTLSFSGMANELVITSTLDLERFPAQPEDLVLEGRTTSYPLNYTPEERRDLATLLLMDDERGIDALNQWIDERGLREGDDALEVARRLMVAVKDGFRYEARYDEGTMRPARMLEAGSGTCRDYAFFMIEAARVLGFAARFATGYLYSPALDGGAADGVMGAAATHAWAELYIPAIGWVDFDPTNALTGSADLIKVASVRKPSQASPVSGSFTGPAGAGGAPQISVAVNRHI